MTSRFPKVRRQIQRAFLAWYNENRARFPMPLLFVGRNDSCLKFSLLGLHPAIRIWLNWEVVVSVEWQGQTWDLLASFEAWLEHNKEGYYCDLCEQAPRTGFASREALWQAHVFEPFLQWLNEILLPAKWLGLYTTGRASTWAELLTEPDDEACEMLSLWINKFRPDDYYLI